MASAARPYRFYAAEISYFSAKARPAFRIKRVPMEEILPTPAAYREVIRPRTGLAMIPTVVTPDDETWQDTSDILDALDRRFPDPPLHAPTPVQRIAGLLLEFYADEFMMLPGLYWRWCFPESVAKALADFASSSGDARSARRFSDAVRGFTAMIGVTPETGPAIEAHTRELLAALEAHFAEHPWLLGGSPSLADCALMGPLYGHLYHDAVSARLLRDTAPRTCHWIERMNHPDPETFGGLLPGDALPPTLRALLALAAGDAVPLTLDTVRAFDAWVEATPLAAGELPRAVGTHSSALRGVAVERLTLPYTLWMVQRVLDAHRTLPAADRAAADAALAGTGWEPLLACAPRHRVERRPYKLFLAARG
jgi:glutathione S-transferase